MIFSRIFTIALPLVACGLAVARPIAAPLPVERSLSGTEIISTLETELGGILPELQGAIDTGETAVETLQPIIQKVETAISAAVTDLQSADLSNLHNDVLALGAGLVADLTKVVGAIVQAAGLTPAVGEVATTVNSSLTELVDLVDTFIPGFSDIATPLLNSLNPATLLNNVIGGSGALLGAVGL